MEGTVKDCLTELSSSTPSFLDHTFVEWTQQSFLRKGMQDMSDGEITVQNKMKFSPLTGLTNRSQFLMV